MDKDINRIKVQVIKSFRDDDKRFSKEVRSR